MSPSIPSLRDIIRDIVREELKKLLPTAERPAVISVAEVVRDEVQRLLTNPRHLSKAGETLLEVGSGPMVWCSLVASSRFKHIVLSDIAECNRLELEKWLNKDKDAIDWTTRAEEVADLEGYSDKKKGAVEILKRTRSAIRKVVPCDVLEPGVLPEEHRETFDVVLSSGCLDSATADHESFRRALRNVGALANSGGLLVLVGFGGLKSYPVGNVDFPHANLTEDALDQAVADAGFQTKLYESVPLGAIMDSPEVFRFILAARKA
ncbi:hypothetical protein HPB47_007386 [Ixodes persulcatus]|uniref:Uncharacterized protein n=1 Tax=Ixodes persulcatus TaxID=34615 RepID=A0AC60P8H4_IXOPE|nr:hypothetical protein HPB47_007386 [Ixodes persulcatus]